MTYLVIGERRSPTAIARDLRWEDGRLCAATLHRALRGVGVDPGHDCRFENLFSDADPADWSPDPVVLGMADRWAVIRGGPVVALGQRVSRALTRRGVPHLTLTHPAARGAIRKRERYDEHVADVLRPPAPTPVAALREAVARRVFVDGDPEAL